MKNEFSVLPRPKDGLDGLWRDVVQLWWLPTLWPEPCEARHFEQEEIDAMWPRFSGATKAQVGRVIGMAKMGQSWWTDLRKR